MIQWKMTSWLSKKEPMVWKGSNFIFQVNQIKTNRWTISLRIQKENKQNLTKEEHIYLVLTLRCKGIITLSNYVCQKEKKILYLAQMIKKCWLQIWFNQRTSFNSRGLLGWLLAMIGIHLCIVCLIKMLLNHKLCP